MRTMKELEQLKKTEGWSSFQAFSRWITGKKFPKAKLEKLVKTHVDFEDYKGNPKEEIMAHFSRLNGKNTISKVL
jgi:hypothetical protein